MLYDLIKTERGKDTVVMTDTLPKVGNRKKTLSTSQKGKKITYSIVPSGDLVKFKKRPHDGSYKSGDRQSPKRA